MAPRPSDRFAPMELCDEEFVFDGRQLTAARALAELSIVVLARAAGVTPRAVQHLESNGRIRIVWSQRRGRVTNKVWSGIVAALEEYGVELLPEGSGHGSGVRWIRPRCERSCEQQRGAKPGSGKMFTSSRVEGE